MVLEVIQVRSCFNRSSLVHDVPDLGFAVGVLGSAVQHQGSRV